MRSTTKAQALEQFRYNWKWSTMGTKRATDSAPKSEAWGIFTDELCREGYNLSLIHIYEPTRPY